MISHSLAYIMRRHPVLKSYGDTFIIDAMVMFGRINDEQAKALRVFHMGCCGLYCSEDDFNKVIKRSVTDGSIVDTHKGINTKHYYDIGDNLIATYRANSIKKYVICYPLCWTRTSTSDTPPSPLGSDIEVLEDVLWMAYILEGNRPLSTSRIVIKDTDGKYHCYNYK